MQTTKELTLIVVESAKKPVRAAQVSAKIKRHESGVRAALRALLEEGLIKRALRRSGTRTSWVYGPLHMDLEADVQDGRRLLHKHYYGYT
jgi:predicted transcriptional regulator